MRLDSLNSMVSAEFRKVSSSHNKKKATSSGKGGSISRNDKASLSSGAGKAGSAEANSKMVAARLQAEPDIREDKIAEVKDKIDSGYYDSSQFANKLADKLIEDFGF
ncbi:MAG: flagellar biosynthesis anti-sigma factor FlgM [Fibrobacterota bacterium]